MFQILFFFSFFSFIFSTLKELIPNPLKEPSKCSNYNHFSSSICDSFNYLNLNELNLLEGEINNLKNIELSIVIISKMISSSSSSDTSNSNSNSISSYSNSEKVNDQAIINLAKEYAVFLHNKWGIGDKEKQNGILIFLSILDRVVYISHGNGFSKQLNSNIIDLLINHMKPYLKQEKYAQALQSVILEIDLLINDSEKSSIQKQAIFRSRFETVFWIGIAIVVLWFFYSSYKSNRHESNLKKGEKALDKLMKDISNESDNKFQFTSCPICLEDFHYPSKYDNNDSETSHSLDSILSNPHETSSSPNSSSSSSSDPLRPMALHCGHAFCYSCLKTYLQDKKNGHKCPICRTPVDPQAPPPQTFPPSSYDPTDCHQHYSSTMPSTTFRYHSPEITYRMNRMRYLYPSVMTADAYERMNRSILNESANEFIQAARDRREQVTLEISNIQRQREMQTKGSKGSSRSSWGGGSSGGGGGGRW